MLKCALDIINRRINSAILIDFFHEESYNLLPIVSRITNHSIYINNKSQNL